MASLSTTELNATIDEKWDMTIEDARYANGVILNRVANRSAIVQKSGDIINVTIEQKLSTGAVGANGTFTPLATTPTSIAITINQYNYVAIELETEAESKSFYDPDSTLPKRAGQAFAELYDTKLGALHSGLTGLTAVGTEAAPVTIDKNALLQAVFTMRAANIPIEDASFILPPEGIYLGVAREEQLTRANEAGIAKNALTTGMKGITIWGIPVYESTVLATVGTPVTVRKGMLIHRSALGIALQRNNDIRRADRTAALVLSKVLVVFSLYGLRVVRPDHGVVINVRAVT